MSMVARFREFVPTGVSSIAAAAKACGLPVAGALADDDHHFGGHLSETRLKATGRGTDPTLIPPPAPGYERACAAIDIATPHTPPAWAGEWLEDVRRRAKAGRLSFLFELIGDPDLIPGLRADDHIAMYAAPSTQWEWVPFTGTGHVAWCHLTLRRDRLSDPTLGEQIFDGWTAAGRKGPQMSDIEIGAAILTAGSHARTAVESVIRNAIFPIPNHTYKTLPEILPALSALADRMAGAGRAAFKKEIKDEILAELRNQRP